MVKVRIKEEQESKDKPWSPVVIAVVITLLVGVVGVVLYYLFKKSDEIDTSNYNFNNFEGEGTSLPASQKTKSPPWRRMKIQSRPLVQPQKSVPLLPPPPVSYTHLRAHET